MNEKIKDYRIMLRLSQEYVANFLGVSRTAYVQMENGARKIAAKDIFKLSGLFGVDPADFSGSVTDRLPPVFEKLDEKDQAGIRSLMKLKERM